MNNEDSRWRKHRKENPIPFGALNFPYLDYYTINADYALDRVYGTTYGMPSIYSATEYLKNEASDGLLARAGIVE